MSSSITLKRGLAIMLVVLVVVSAMQIEPAEAAQKSDLIFVKGKFIKKDKKGTIVVEEKEHCGCHGRRR